MTTPRIARYWTPKVCSVGYRLISMATMLCGRLPPNKASSCAVKDFRELVCVLAFAIERAPDNSERLGKWKDVAGNKQVVVFRAHRMPVDALNGNGEFRYQIAASNSNTFAGRATQSDPAYHSIFFRNPLLIQELAKLLSFGIG